MSVKNVKKLQFQVEEVLKMQFQFEEDFYPDIFKSKTFELSGKIGLHRYAMLVKFMLIFRKTNMLI